MLCCDGNKIEHKKIKIELGGNEFLIEINESSMDMMNDKNKRGQQ